MYSSRVPSPNRWVPLLKPGHAEVGSWNLEDHQYPRQRRRFLTRQQPFLLKLDKDFAKLGFDDLSPTIWA
jgi:hypothetical protein